MRPSVSPHCRRHHGHQYSRHRLHEPTKRHDSHWRHWRNRRHWHWFGRRLDRTAGWWDASPSTAGEHPGTRYDAPTWLRTCRLLLHDAHEALTVRLSFRI